MSTTPLKASVSLWSADLADLAAEIGRVDPYADMYHLDVSDGTYAAGLLLFFPDLVKAIRPSTKKPLEVHLITQQPEHWVDPFADAGADLVLFYADATSDVPATIERITARGLKPGISLAVDHPLSLVEPYLDRLAIVCVLGTGFDVKGVEDVAGGTCEKIRQLVDIRRRLGLTFEIEADGAIRRHTTAKLRQAGTDIVVPGSLMFKNDMPETSRWLRSL